MLSIIVINFNQNAQLYAASILTPSLLTELNLSYALGGTLISAYMLSLALVITPAGMIGDKLGGRLVFLAGAAFMSAGSLSLTLAGDFNLAFLSRVITGIGAAAVITMTGPITSYWFDVRQFRVVHGMGTAISKIGAVFSTWVMPPLILALGWRLGYGVLSLAGPISLVVGLALLTSKPTDVGLPAMQLWVDPRATAEGAEADRCLGVWQLLRLRSMVPLCIASLFYFGAYFGAVNWVPTYMARVLGMNSVEGGFETGMIVWGTVIGYAITGPAANRLGRCRPLYLGGLACTGCLTALFATAVPQLPAWVLPPLLLLNGLAFSGLLLMTPMLAVLVPRGSLATGSGIVFTTSYLGAVALPPLIGAAADLTGSLAVAFWLPAACGFLGVLAALFIHEPTYPTGPSVAH